jgi:hypothetical protein
MLPEASRPKAGQIGLAFPRQISLSLLKITSFSGFRNSSRERGLCGAFSPLF